MITPDVSHEKTLLKEILTHLRIARGPDAREEYVCWCPFHPDGQGKPPHQPNLVVSERGFYCHACGAKGSLAQLAEKLGVQTKVAGNEPEAIYDYCDENGALLFQVTRFRGKRFRQRRPDGKGGWIWDLKSVRRVPYRLPELLTAPQDETIYIVEGEKDCDRLAAAGLVATTNPGGAGKWRREYNELLRGRAVAILSDNDEPGRAHVQSVAYMLHGTAESIKLIDLPGLPEKGDVSDWLNAGHTIEELKCLIDAASNWTPTSSQVSAPIAIEQTGSAKSSWPDPPADAAFRGLAGDFVRAIEPHTEADPVALLLSYFVVFGNLIGRCAYFIADGAKHFTNLFCILVGVTSKSRKGTAWAQALHPFNAVDEGWVKNRVKQGLSSGEGLIWAVRDAAERAKHMRPRKRNANPHAVVDDAGVMDKRLLIAEPEFALILRVMGRDGNILSAILRTAWDTGDLCTLTKNNPAKATGTHISIMAHITRDECLRYLDTTEAGNGFGNRFLWACVKRSKLLPEGGRIDEVDFSALTQRLSAAVVFARSMGEMKRDEEARALWHEVYPALSEGRPGLLGAILARAEAQVMRLACIYALLEQSALVKREHLEAALSLWRYCEDSARFIFNDSLGDPVADEILRVLREAGEGLTRTELNHHFGRNKEAREITRALKRLFEHGLARYEKENGTTGRPAELWFAEGLSHLQKSGGTK